MTEKKEPQLVRRIDRNIVIGGKDAILKIVMSDQTKSHKLYRVGGHCIGTVRGAGKFGDWMKLVGRFRAIRATDGEVFDSGSAFLPSDIASMVDQRLSAPNRDGELPDGVTFLYDVYVRYDSQLATSYAFIVEPVRPASEGNPLDNLFAQAEGNRLEGPREAPALAGPDTPQQQARKSR